MGSDEEEDCEEEVDLENAGEEPFNFHHHFNHPAARLLGSSYHEAEQIKTSLN